MSLLVAGNNPAAVKTAERNIFTATASQTTFTITQGYQPGDIDVYLNGVRLVDTEDYIANNGTTVVLTSGALVGDSVVVICFRPFQVADFYTKSEQDTRYVNASGDTMTGELIAPFLTLDRRSWTTGLKIGTTSKDFAIYREWANNANTISVGNVTDGVENIRFDISGRVIMPNQPSFYAYHSTSPTPTNASLFVFDSTNYNSGMYSTSTGRMTAPVAGRYLVSVAFRVNQQNAGYYAQTLLYVNGGSTWQGSYHNSTMSPGGAGYMTVIYTGILSLGQGDYVQPYWVVQAGTTQFSGVESWFSGHLLG